MSVQGIANDRHLEIHRNVHVHLSKAVHRVRIEVHNLRAEESEERDGKSENHVTFAMLLGGGESVRVDMAPNPTTNLGKLSVRYRDNIVSAKTIRLSDINARGCSDNFDPDRRPARNSHSHSVNQFLLHIVTSNMHRYRFMEIDGQPLGCRCWVKSVLDSLLVSGFLREDVNLASGIEGSQSPDHLLDCQWDARLNNGIRAQMFPGIFLGAHQSSSLNIAGIQQRLLTANPRSLIRLAKTLDRRNDQPDTNLGAQYTQFLRWAASLEQNQRPNEMIRNQQLSYTGLFARLANLEEFEGMAAEDLATAAANTGASQLFQRLDLCLSNRYSEAQSCLKEARQSPHPGDRFVYSLIAVCDMAGDEDEEDEEDE